MTEKSTQPMFPEARAKKLHAKKKVWLIALFGSTAFFIVGGTIAFFAGYHDAKNGKEMATGALPALLTISTLAATILSMWWSIGYWRSIDEMARRAHLDSWFWGGVLGSIPLLVLGGVTLSIPELKFPMIEALGMSSTQSFGLGALAIYGCMLLGYTIFWLIWWARKR
jgi:hypothetical protein